MENEIVGRKFGKWTVLGVSKEKKKGNKRWDCVCECGTKKAVVAGSLISGKSTSCHCKRLKTGATKEQKNTTEYVIWIAIRKRCLVKNNKRYSLYGGRGIKICDRWKESFPNFLKDMGKRPSKKHSIDRIDNDGDYSPENCRWATMKEQTRNKSNNVWLEHNGVRLVRADLAAKLGISVYTLKKRLKNYTDKEKIFEPEGTK